MKTSIKSLVVLCATFVLASGLALAETSSAVFISADGCGMLDESGNGIIAGEGRQISANSANGNVTLTCSTEFDRPLDIKRSVIWNYDNTLYNPLNEGQCFTWDGPTDDWHQVITPSGKVKLICHLKQ